MSGRLDRLNQCAELDNLELVSTSLSHGYCAPIDNQGLYLLSKVISNFMGAGIEASALFILTLPIYISLCLSLCWRWSRSAIALPLFVIAAIEFGLNGRLFQLAEWAFPFWLGMMSVIIFYSYYERDITPSPHVLLLMGAVFALAEWIRPSAGLVGHVVLCAFAFMYFAKLNYLKIIKLVLLFYAGYGLVLIITGEINSNIEESAATIGFAWVHMDHVFWHMILIGLGQYQNEFNLVWNDQSGLDYVAEKFAAGIEIDGYSKFYEFLARESVVEIVWSHPLFFLKTLGLKLLKLLAHYLSFVVLFGVCNLLNADFRRSMASIIMNSKNYLKISLIPLTLLMLASAPGLLTAPSRYYVPGALVLVLLFCMHATLSSSNKAEI
jgi:hypothetical protein